MAFLNGRLSRVRRTLGVALLLLGHLAPGSASAQTALSNTEKELKVAFIYNFTLFTDWPTDVGGTLNVCVLGLDPFGPALDALEGKVAAGRTLAVQRKGLNESLNRCQVLFITASAMDNVPRVLEGLGDNPTLTIADSPGAAARGVALNMNVVKNKVTFQANLQAVRAARLNLSSKLLRLATDVVQ